MSLHIIYFIDWLPVAGPPLDPTWRRKVNQLKGLQFRGLEGLSLIKADYIVRGDGVFMAAVEVRLEQDRGQSVLFNVPRMPIVRMVSAMVKQEMGHVDLFHNKLNHRWAQTEHSTLQQKMKTWWRKLFPREDSEASIFVHDPVIISDPYGDGMKTRMIALKGIWSPPSVPQVSNQLLGNLVDHVSDLGFMSQLRGLNLKDSSETRKSAIQALRHEVLRQRDIALQMYDKAGQRSRHHRFRWLRIMPVWVLSFVIIWYLLNKSVGLLFDIIDVSEKIQNTLSFTASMFFALFVLIQFGVYHDLKFVAERRLKILLQADGYQRMCAPFYHSARIIFDAGVKADQKEAPFVPADVFAPMIKRAEVRMMRHAVHYQVMVGLLGVVMAVFSLVVAFRSGDSVSKDGTGKDKAGAPPAISTSAPAKPAVHRLPEGCVAVCFPDVIAP
jgi:hypothetical protein